MRKETGNGYTGTFSLDFKTPNMNSMETSLASGLLRGSHLIVAILENLPYVKIVERSATKINNVEGFVSFIVEWLSRKYRFTYDYVQPPDMNYGGITNGSWNGLIGMVVRGDADLAGADLSITYERSSAVEFTYAYANDPDVLLMPYPQLASNVTGIVRPFDIMVWIGIIVVLFITAIAVFQITRLESRLLRKYTKNMKISEHVWLLFRVIANPDDLSRVPSTLSTRLVLTVWCLASFVLVQSYTSCLASYLMTPKFIPFVRSVKEFADNDDMVLVVQRFTSQESNFLIATTGTLGKLGDKLRAHPENSVENFDNIANIVFRERKVYAFEESIQKSYQAEDFKQTNQCRMISGKEHLSDNRCAFAMPKSSPLVKAFNRDLMWLHETGLIQHWTEAYLPKENYCSSQLLPGQAATKKKLSLDFLSSAFVMYGVGIGFSFMVLLYEIIFQVCLAIPSKVR